MIITEFDKESRELDTREANDNDPRFDNESAVNEIANFTLRQRLSCTQS